mgnify:CR=1 FL=1
MTELECLVEVTANLRAYIEQQVEATAGPQIVRARRRAENRIAEAEALHRAEMQRQTDLVEELRHQLRPLDRMHERTKQATFAQRSDVLALGLDCHRCEGLIVEVEPGSTLTEVMTAYVNHYCQEGNQ